MHFSRIILGLLGTLAFLPVSGSAFAGNPAHAALQDGLSHIESSVFERAVEDFTVALSSGDLSTDERVLALFNRGVAWDCVGESENAIADYSAALELNPLYAPALNNRANAYRLSDRAAEAKRDYDAVLKLTSGANRVDARAYAYFGLSALAAAEGDATAAQDYLDRARMIPSESTSTAVDASGGATGDDRAYSNVGAPPLTVGGAEPVHLHRTASKPYVSKARQSGGQADCVRPAGPSLRLRLPVVSASCQDRLPAPSAAKIVRAVGPAPAKSRVQVRESGESVGYAVQLGSYRSSAVAEAAWEHFLKTSGGVLRGLSPLILETDIPQRGHFFRVRVRVDSFGTATALCLSLTGKGTDCLVVRQAS